MSRSKIISAGVLATALGTAATIAGENQRVLSCTDIWQGTANVEVTRQGGQNFTATVSTIPYNETNPPVTIPGMNCHKPDLTVSDDFNSIQISRMFCEQLAYDENGMAKTLSVRFDKTTGAHRVMETVFRGKPGAPADENTFAAREIVSSRQVGGRLSCDINPR